MNIRPYRADDWARLCVIHDAARVEELQAAVLADAFLPLPIAAEREHLFDYRVQVAEWQGQVLGFVADDGDELAWLYVDPAARRRGVGQALVTAVQDASPAGLTLELLDGNVAALAFYRACGFVETGVQHGRMPGNEAFAVRVRCMRWPGVAT
ncbi:GNAT family N-acetyltransferase [Xanthomonas rydalmerensis]|uniref:GNAT family N-acetyltransferase n=1 Tax=Xanthomonas rydalmerensis TaxID=3046274 RepID=A0ABZ0JQX2_9XANT|nr:GNAT family N-acetyltransferase [Xanthomonas sp. DM-2023]WOS42234.1 GNAT family N-acetyltransferase [Xanthomonas sp. DM-2023]WOS46421.1 GNAT family N-acetyltransferase [Xanthomonas sp. DM-2023]WOS50600.1 GNAT family N-acetyltransferase [Xanthomonas sp. DM-2023]WOS54780.1 GNAT family N-acetyltransferase [Xanthomonas sp. DM-2023]WOS58963.1 GNAT family N-acetyltransferase [Xanthomonas sp. DM-2023]